MIALVIWVIDFSAASRGASPSRSISDCVFSTTTIASSTSEPITRMRPNIVSTFSVKPKTCRTMNVPSSETGIATAGMKVARQSCRKT